MSQKKRYFTGRTASLPLIDRPPMTEHRSNCLLPPDPPYDIETMEPLAIHRWRGWADKPKHHQPNGGVV